MNIQFDNFILSAFESSQAPLLFNLIDSNRSRLEAFFSGTVSQTKNLEDTINYSKLIDKRQAEKSYFPFIISDKVSGAFIGLVDVKNIDWSVPKAEIGYFIDKNYEGQGIISKALAAVVDYIVEKYSFKKLLCRANSQNLGSIHVALKNGFEFEGTIRNDYKTTDNTLVDLNYYGRIFE